MTDDPQKLGDNLYAWQVHEPGGSWATIGAQIPGTQQWAPLINRTEKLMLDLRWLAELHADAFAQQAGIPTPDIRLAKFTLTQIMEEGQP